MTPSLTPRNEHHRTEPPQTHRRRGAMPSPTASRPVVRLASAATLLALIVIALACNPVSPTPSPSASPASTAPPSASPRPVGAIDHKTGATDVILRMDRGGGFVPIDFLATQAPTFTLYGNGVIVFQPRVAQFPQPDAVGVTHNIPWRTAKLDEGQVQELLDFAITQGGLGTARAVYMASGIADAPSTIFTLRAGGLDKSVTIEALNEQTAQGPDALARSAFIRLAQRLEDFDRAGTIGSDVYEPAAYRGVLSEGAAGGAVPTAWPWPALKPADFKAGPNDGSGGVFLPHRTMTADEVAALGIKDFTGGLQGVVLRGPDGKLYGFTARPLLVDEKE